MLHALISLLSTVLWVLELLVVGRVVLGWLGANPSGRIVKALHAATEPLFQLMKPIARKIPGPLDWTPALVLLALTIVQWIL
jgi:YggT family protein